MADNAWLTETGETLLAQALVSAVPLNIDTWKIGTTENVALDQTLTDVVGTVADTGTTAELSFDITSPDQVTIKLTLQESKGPYNIGNIGLFNGTDLVAFATFENAREKIPNAVGVVGNRLVLNIPIQFVDVQDAIDFTILSVSTASWPFVQTIADLPDANLSAFEGYIVREDPSQNRPITAIRNEEPALSGTFVWTLDYHNKLAGDTQANEDCIEIDTTTGEHSFKVNTTEYLRITDGQVLLSTDGSAGTPALSFGTDLDTGVTRSGEGLLSLISNGNERLTIASSGVLGNVTITESELVGAVTNSASNTLVLQSATDCGITIFSDESNFGSILFGNQSNNYEAAIQYNHAANLMFFRSNSNNVLGLNSDEQIIAYNLGTANIPSFSWASDPDTGLSAGGNNLIASAGGEEIVRFSNNGLDQYQVTATAGTETHPSYTFNTTTTSGMWSSAANQISWSTNGTERIRLTNTSLELLNGVTLQFPDGNKTTPSIAFVTDPDTGLYRVSSGVIGFTGNDTELAKLSSAGIRLDSLGSSTFPSYSWDGFEQYGMYLNANEIAFSLGTTERFRISAGTSVLSSALQVTGPVNSTTAGFRASSGSASEVAYGFNIDPQNDTGMYLENTNEIKFSINSADKFQIDTNLVESFVQFKAFSILSSGIIDALGLIDANAGISIGSGTTISESQNISKMYSGRVNAAGTAVDLPAGWSSSYLAAGSASGLTIVFRITHNLGTLNYSFVATGESVANFDSNVAIVHRDANFIEYVVSVDSAVRVQNDINFMLFVN